MNLEEQKAKTRQMLYTIAAVASVGGPALTVALTEGGVSNWVALLVAVLGAMTGGAGAAMAARKVGQQRKEGAFEPAPPPAPPMSAVDQVIGGLAEVTGKAIEAGRDLDKVTEAANTALGLGLNMADAVVDAIRDAKK